MSAWGRAAPGGPCAGFLACLDGPSQRLPCSSSAGLGSRGGFEVLEGLCAPVPAVPSAVLLL